MINWRDGLTELSLNNWLSSIAVAAVIFIAVGFVISYLYQLGTARRTRRVAHGLWIGVLLLPLVVIVVLYPFVTKQFLYMMLPGILFYCFLYVGPAFLFLISERRVIVVLSSFQAGGFRGEIGRVLRGIFGSCGTYLVETESSFTQVAQNTGIPKNSLLGISSSRYIPFTREILAIGEGWKEDVTYLLNVALLIIVDESFDTPGVRYEREITASNDGFDGKTIRLSSGKNSNNKKLTDTIKKEFLSKFSGPPKSLNGEILSVAVGILYITLITSLLFVVISLKTP